jgi:hypothetical protein
LCEGHDTCYSGEPWRGYCRACGDYLQPCCLNTAYPCDYGECNSDGICKRRGSGSSSSSSGTGGGGGGCFLATAVE